VIAKDSTIRISHDGSVTIEFDRAVNQDALFLFGRGTLRRKDWTTARLDH